MPSSYRVVFTQYVSSIASVFTGGASATSMLLVHFGGELNGFAKVIAIIIFACLHDNYTDNCICYDNLVANSLDIM